MIRGLVLVTLALISSTVLAQNSTIFSRPLR
jgi:hypothetical protein